jgi:hypothetical protein
LSRHILTRCTLAGLFEQLCLPHSVLITPSHIPTSSSSPSKLPSLTPLPLSLPSTLCNSQELVPTASLAVPQGFYLQHHWLNQECCPPLCSDPAPKSSGSSIRLYCSQDHLASHYTHHLLHYCFFFLPFPAVPLGVRLVPPSFTCGTARAGTWASTLGDAASLLGAGPVVPAKNLERGADRSKFWKDCREVLH